MKSPIELWQKVAIELGDRCCACTTRDIQTVTRRWKTEGWPYLTVTLPAFAKDFERALEQEQVTPDLFNGFAKRGSTPKFLGELMDQVFDRSTGLLVPTTGTMSQVDAVHAIRQLTLMFGKIQVEPSELRKEATWENWWNTEAEVAEWSRILESTSWIPRGRTGEERYQAYSQIGHLRQEFRYYARTLFGRTLDKLSMDIDQFQVVPKHGPGATAERTSSNQKYVCRSWPRRLDRVFPVVEYAIPSYRFIPELDGVAYPDPEAETPVRVVSVPKDGRGPRLIAIEPVAMQYMQQGLLEKLVQYLESDKTTRHFVGFTDQEPNRVLARHGSLTGELATLDLKDASDRVSRVHVQDLLHAHRTVLDGVEACRSTRALAYLPQSRRSGEFIEAETEGFDPQSGQALRVLEKFASMGSALTFPLEAMVFTTIIFVAIGRVEGHRLSRREIHDYRGKVRVYGDDIIVPAEFAPLVASTLELFGLTVNKRKSFWNGKFRESCGSEFFAGNDVTVARVRREFPDNQRDGWRRNQALNLVSLVSLRNRFYESGLWKTAGWLDEWIESLIRFYPRVSPTSPVLGRHSYLGYETQRMSDRTHSPQVRGYCVSTKAPRDHLEGYGALMKWFLKRSDEPFASRDHLERHGRPDAVSIKLRWSSPF